jgi:DNA-damage-inducible protein D
MANEITQKPPTGNDSPFERIKRINGAGNEYWSSRDFSQILGYSDYRNFEQVIKKAKTACFNSGHRIEDHFVDITDMVGIGSGAQRPVSSVYMSRYACYLIIQNADPGKEIVALGQTYFAVQTRKQEVSEQETEDSRRLLLRQEMKTHNVHLAANLFRATQTEEKLRRENIKGKEKANRTHKEVGAKIRQTIRELGGTMPEDLPVAEDIKKLDAKRKKELKDKAD